MSAIFCFVPSILDLYEGVWQNHPLGPKDYVISADEKTSIQARKRKHVSQGPGPGKITRIEHEYEKRCRPLTP